MHHEEPQRAASSETPWFSRHAVTAARPPPPSLQAQGIPAQDSQAVCHVARLPAGAGAPLGDVGAGYRGVLVEKGAAAAILLQGVRVGALGPGVGLGPGAVGNLWGRKWVRWGGGGRGCVRG